MNTWAYDIGNWYPEEGSPYIGNGWIGGNIPLNGHGGEGNRHLAAMAANYMGRDETYRAVPHWLNVDIRFDGKPVKAWFFDFHKVLDLKTGVFLTEYLDGEKNVRVSCETFCHRGEAPLAAYRLVVKALKPGLQLDRGLVDADFVALAPEGHVQMLDGHRADGRAGEGQAARNVLGQRCDGGGADLQFQAERKTVVGDHRGGGGLEFVGKQIEEGVGRERIEQMGGNRLMGQIVPAGQAEDVVPLVDLQVRQLDLTVFQGQIQVELVEPHAAHFAAG